MVDWCRAAGERLASASLSLSWPLSEPISKRGGRSQCQEERGGALAGGAIQAIWKEPYWAVLALGYLLCSVSAASGHELDVPSPAQACQTSAWMSPRPFALTTSSSSVVAVAQAGSSPPAGALDPDSCAAVTALSPTHTLCLARPSGNDSARFNGRTGP
ncbi:unnamed protein product [Clonostachys rosea]|uniref:Uncharacterized protein n=1 Tax=Bionectria ochroleuca TaxID=29856 RepID=A0ABY6TSY4_BIOOC|nr:unnamed protein product [Clonostachys rosea]